jgi:hypothetical protein
MTSIQEPSVGSEDKEEQMTTQEEPQVDNVGRFDVMVDRGNKIKVNQSQKQKDLILEGSSKDNEGQMITRK